MGTDDAQHRHPLLGVTSGAERREIAAKPAQFPSDETGQGLGVRPGGDATASGAVHVVDAQQITENI